MRPFTIVAIYFLFWFLSLFLVLPFEARIRRDDVEVEKVPGQAESAPPHFSFPRVALRTTLIAAAFFGLFYANYVNGWVDVHSFDWIFDPPGKELK